MFLSVLLIVASVLGMFWNPLAVIIGTLGYWSFVYMAVKSRSYSSISDVQEAEIMDRFDLDIVEAQVFAKYGYFWSRPMTSPFLSKGATLWQFFAVALCVWCFTCGIGWLSLIPLVTMGLCSLIRPLTDPIFFALEAYKKGLVGGNEYPILLEIGEKLNKRRVV